jgi:uncharacterized protein (TIGR02266 family)
MAYQTNTQGEPPSLNLPIAQAQEMLVQTLKVLRGVSTTNGFDLENTIFSISEATSLLDGLDPQKIKEMTYVSVVSSAMNRLREALADLQLNNHAAGPVEETTKAIAKTLAILYPLSKFGESRIPSDPIPPRLSVPQHIRERRQATRIAIEAEVGFQSDTNFFMGFSEDVSTGGLFISTYDIRPIGEVLNLNFTLPDGHLISVDGVVRWVREYNETTPDIPPGMGVQFESLTPEDKEAIEMFIEERPALFYDDE